MEDAKKQFRGLTVLQKHNPKSFLKDRTSSYLLLNTVIGF